MKNAAIKTSDYLFMQFRTLTPTLEQVCDVYYPHLSKAKILEKARNEEFPFCCFKLDTSQKAPYFVDIIDLAFVLEEKYKSQFEDYKKLIQSVLKPDQHK
ncbi:pyocin activator PrtN family protein [Acinetobacter guerrae]|uniref:pyocin activator PrtN family protein n=1 Tax=Acinetobacter guerrae TaxID=1843371 RepID=UPI00125EF854|nr:pyocin activator PrtN family protein [Acinetobacter guerrae]